MIIVVRGALDRKQLAQDLASFIVGIPVHSPAEPPPAGCTHCIFSMHPTELCPFEPYDIDVIVSLSWSDPEWAYAQAKRRGDGFLAVSTLHRAKAYTRVVDFLRAWE